MRGKISQWKDDKGFGFILPEKGEEKLFFHISNVKNQSKRPQIGDIVLYEHERDIQGRLRAKGIRFESVISKPKKHAIIHTDPVKKDIFDYLAIAVLVLCIIAIVYEEVVPAVILGVICMLLLRRQKNPKKKQFTCCRCHRNNFHSKRTIQAWNNGFIKLFCGSCHQKWLREKENTEPVTYVSSHTKGHGCLGIVLLSITTVYSIYEWFI